MSEKLYIFNVLDSLEEARTLLKENREVLLYEMQLLNLDEGMLDALESYGWNSVGKALDKDHEIVFLANKKLYQNSEITFSKGKYAFCPSWLVPGEKDFQGYYYDIPENSAELWHHLEIVEKRIKKERKENKDEDSFTICQ